MKTFFTRRAIAIGIVFVVIFAVLGIGFFAFFISRNKAQTETPAVVVSKPEALGPTHTVIGQSVQGRNIEAYTYGNGKTHLVFVGGIHGGYEWNTVVLAYQFIDYFNANPKAISADLTVTVIPDANPDGVFKVTGIEGRFTIANVSTDAQVLTSGRFNADDVDLNRNFDCKWQPQSTWQSKTVSAGTAAFSEPEAQALRDFLLKENLAVVVFWHSQSGTVYASQCENGILPETLNTMDAYAKDSGYPAVKTFDAYATTGGADDWLASVNIPAFTVELKTHDTIEWQQNLAGVSALFEYYK
jgi:g-D-glutamyl-meso-diaminopimelate peptidase